MTRYLVPILCVLAAAMFVIALLEVIYAPQEYNLTPDGRLVATSLFWNYKIMFWHVGNAFWLFGAVMVAGVTSIAFLATRNPRWDDIASGSVDVAIMFGAVVLATGSIWAKAAWDVWWKWEPRLTMSLLLWLILVGYALVRKFAGPSADRIAAGMAIFGMVGVPFIYKMVGQDSHPASGSQGVVATLGPGMRGPFWLSVLAFLLWFILLTITRVQSTRAERELRELREKGLDLGVLE